MRILYLSNSEIPSRAANSVHVMKMCNAFASQHEITLVARQGEEAIGNGDDFVTYGVSRCFGIRKEPSRGRSLTSRVGFALSSRRHLRDFHPVDLVYSRHLLSAWIASRYGHPFVFEAHCAPGAWERWLQSRLFRRPNFRRLVVISDALRCEFLRIHPTLCEQQIMVAHDGADPVSQTAVESSESWIPASQHRLQVGYIGHLYPGKGMEVVYELTRRMPNVDFHVVGGTEEDLSHWKSLMQADKNVTFHGFVPHAATEAFRRNMDVLLAPYQTSVGVSGGGQDIARWMSPLKLFEYMSNGGAIIASNLPVLREVLTHEETALLVPPQDFQAWEAAVHRLRDSALRQRLGDNARSVFQSSYTWSARAQTVLDGL
jgi:glycosyltransferase involved in cell wall biosynthesis